MDEFSERRARLLEKAGVHAAIFHNGGSGGIGRASFNYFSGCDVDGAYLVLRRNGGALLVREMDYREAEAASRHPVRLLGKNAAAQIRQECGGGKAGACFADISASRHLALRKMAKLRLVDIGESVMAVRARKSRSEAKKIEDAAKITRGILGKLDPWECKTESGLAFWLRMAALENGCEMAFEPIVATGKNSAHPHHKPGSAKLGDSVLVDFGVKKAGYCSDFTRCYFRKGGMEEERAYGKCRAIFEGIMERLPDCSTGKDVAVLSSGLLKANGLPKPIHSIGHGVGMDVHENPRLGAKSGDSLEGAVIALEPAAYFTRFGVRFEGMAANINGKWKPL